MKFNVFQRAVMRAFNIKADQMPLIDDGRVGTPIGDHSYDVIGAVERDMERNPFVYSAVTKKAAAIASVPFFVERLNVKENTWGRIDHEATSLIENGNPNMTSLHLKQLLVYHKELTGSGFWQIARDSQGVPQFVQPLFPQHMKVIPSARSFVAGYEYRIGSGDATNLKPEQVMWSRYPHPASPYRVLPPLKAIAGEIHTDLAAIEWNLSSLRGRGATDAAFLLRDVKTEEQYKLAKRMIMERYTGVHNGRAPWIIGGDSDVRPLSYNPVEMDYLNTRIFNRQVVAAAFGVPAPLIGDADNSTYNNLDTLKRVFWEDTVTTWLEELRQDLTVQILHRYWAGDRRSERKTLRFKYDLSNVEALAQNWKEKAEIARLLAQAGFDSNQINERLDLGMIAPTIPLMAQPVPDEEPKGVDSWHHEIAELIEKELTRGADPRSWLPPLHSALASHYGSEADQLAAFGRAESLSKALSLIGRDGNYRALALGVAEAELEVAT